MVEVSAPPIAGARRENVAALVEEEPLALFLDVDGTLLDIAARPDDVVTPARLVETLADVERKLDGALALVSGRPIAELDRVFQPLKLRASGIHGAEIRFDPLGPTTATPAAIELPHALWSALQSEVAPFPGAFAEDKRYSFVVHYRLAPEAERPLRQAITRLAGSSPISLQVIDGRSAIELKPPGFDKGSAIATFLAAAPFRGRLPVFVGDDSTDESGFAFVAARGGRAYAVGKPRPGAAGLFAGPDAVRDWLAEFVRRGDDGA